MPEARRRLVHHLGLRQDAAPDRDHRVGGEDEGFGEIVAVARRLPRDLGLRAGEALCELARRLGLQRRFVDIGRKKRVGLDAGLLQEREATRRAGRQHELRAPSGGCAARRHETEVHLGRGLAGLRTESRLAGAEPTL